MSPRPNRRWNDLRKSSLREERDTKDTLAAAKGDPRPSPSLFFRCNDEGVGTEHLRVAVFDSIGSCFHFLSLFFPGPFPPPPIPFFSRAETRPWWESSQNCCRFKDLPSNPLNATCGTIRAKALEAKINYVSVPSEARDGYSHKRERERKKMSTSWCNQCNPGPSSIRKTMTNIIPLYGC